MHKRILTLLTILSLSTALLIGCGSTQETPTQSETTTTETVEVSDGTTEETTADTTEEPVSEPLEEPASEPSEEPASEPSEEPVSEPSEEPVSEPSEEPVSEPQVMYTYTDMSATMYATQTVNVRDLPCTDGEKIGSLSLNQEITVLGQCNETSWYMFDYNGQTAFVSNKYVSTEKVEIQQAPPSNNGGGSAPVDVPNPYELPLQTWLDYGHYFIYIQPSLSNPEPRTDSPFWTEKEAIIKERYPGYQTLNGWGIWLDNGEWTVWGVVGYETLYEYPGWQGIIDNYELP